jgi:hypothetical protein
VTRHVTAAAAGIWIVSSRLKALIAAGIVAGAGLAIRAMRHGSGAMSPDGGPATTPREAAGPESPPHRAPTRAELYEEAKRRGIPGRSNMTKAQLQTALEKGV